MSEIIDFDRDPFALDRGDKEILSLFRRWRAESRIAGEVVYSDEVAWEAALARQDEIEEQIIALRAGPIGLAVKAFLHYRLECVDWTPTAANIRDETLF